MTYSITKLLLEMIKATLMQRGYKCMESGTNTLRYSQTM
jgi:hypothetical protein